MNDTMVIVAVHRVDAETENTNPVIGSFEKWMLGIPLEFDQMYEKLLSKLDPRFHQVIETVITGSTQENSPAKDRMIRAHMIENKNKSRPSDVLSILGTTMVIALGKILPNMQNVFKLDAACATGLVAIDVASLIAKTRDQVVMIMAVDKSTAPYFQANFNSLNALASGSRYCAPFDVDRNGFAMGEGAALMIVCTRTKAEQLKLPIIAELNAVATKTIATHPTDPGNIDQIQQFITNAIVTSKCSLDEFAYWDAHGTATPVGDELEYKIFAKIFNDQDVAISSFKSRIGHCMSASALIELVNSIENMQTQTITPNYGIVNKMINDDRIITQARCTNKKTFIKTSFGFGGRNAVAVVTVK
jgi:3-oxoacyl-[acyl-carrier-protein] synthase II